MDNLTEQKQKAKEFRKAGKFEEALPLYRDLWKQTGDGFDGVGLLQCLRKLELFDEGITLAEELIVKHTEFNWCRNEVIWTFISGVLYKLEENEPLEKVIKTAQKIMDLNPNGLAAKMIVFKVLKSSKAHNDWGKINEWVVKIDPNLLSAEPMTDSSGRKGWSDKSLWYNYRIKGLVKEGGKKEAQEAINIVDEILEGFPRERKFFLRLKALANQSLGRFSESEKIYENLCSGYKADWWMLHDYGRVVRDAGRKEDALKLMYQAAISNKKLEAMVSLLADIGMLCKKMGKNEEARAHLILCRYVRDKNDWSVPESVLNGISELNKIIGNNNAPESLEKALSICKSYWLDLLGEKRVWKSKVQDKREIRKGLLGKMSLGKLDSSFCFIVTEDEESFFCFKKDLPPDIKDGNKVTFNAIPSFDKKKNKKSWKATNIQHCT